MLCGPIPSAAGADGAASKFTDADTVTTVPSSAVPVMVYVLFAGATVVLSQQSVVRSVPNGARRVVPKSAWIWPVALRLPSVSGVRRIMKPPCSSSTRSCDQRHDGSAAGFSWLVEGVAVSVTAGTIFG